MPPALLSSSRLARRGATLATPNLTYGELAARAARVAEAVDELADGRPVGLFSKGRGLDEVVGLTALLTRGHPVVPLDIHAPRRRHEALLERVGAKVVIADRSDFAGVSVVQLDARGQLEGTVRRAPPLEAGPFDASVAAILFTSGSTGAPKAIPIRTAGLVAFADWMAALAGLDEGRRVLRVAELSFDLSWFDHFATLRHGATLVTAPRRSFATAKGVGRTVADSRPHVIYAVPRFWQAIPSEVLRQSALDRILFAGEVFPPGPLHQLSKAAPDRARLFNLYGPTETNVCTFHEVERGALDGRTPVPIGRLTPYCRGWLMDGETRIEGAGRGELWVDGPTVMAGPHATRDLVERDDAGLLHFRGRLDDMIKIRGYRVEPAEVERALLVHPAVNEAVIKRTADPRWGWGLTAYVTGDPSPEVELRRFVRKRLPSFMVPDRIHWRAQLPRTANGKLDRHAVE
ncbi:MAG: AMP-binding protein [Myxococcota bacterium]